MTPIVGRIVDARGPRYVLVAACLLLLVGYSVIRAIYDNGAPSSGSISIFTFGVLVFSSFMTGAGGSGGLTSSINATMKSFPEGAVSQTVYLVFLLAFIAHKTESYYYRDRYIRLWSVRILLLDHITHHISRQHVLLPATLSPRHVLPNDNRILPRSHNPTTRLRSPQ